jgi:hypothetical protein
MWNMVTVPPAPRVYVVPGVPRTAIVTTIRLSPPSAALAVT